MQCVLLDSLGARQGSFLDKNKMNNNNRRERLDYMVFVNGSGHRTIFS